MISEKDLVERSIEDMQAEASELLSEAERLKEEHEAALQKVMLLRTGSVESRPIDSAEAERLAGGGGDERFGQGEPAALYGEEAEGSRSPAQNQDP